MAHPYELLYVIRPDLDEEGLTQVLEKYSSLIQEQGGQVEEINRWGKRRLAYEIKRFREGYYVLVHFRGEPHVPRELDRVFKISEDVIRHLITRRDEDQEKVAQ